MAPVVIFPDATRVVADYLRAELTARGQAAPVWSRVPTPRPARFVLARRLGGPRLNLVADGAQIGVECWDSSEETAHDLCQLCRALIHAMPGTVQGGVPIYRVTEVGGPATLPDPLSDSPRCVATFIVSMRGTA